MGILSIEPHNALDLDQMMANIGFEHHHDWTTFNDRTIAYRWKYTDVYGLGIACIFCCHSGHCFLKRIIVTAKPDFESCSDVLETSKIEGQLALDEIRHYVLKQTDGIIDIFKDYE